MLTNAFRKYLQQLTPISDKEFDDTVDFFKEQVLQKGDFFVTSGKVCQQVAFINSGSFRVFYLNEKGEDITSCFCTSNNFTTSYKSFILQQPSSLSIQAIEMSEILVIDYEGLQHLYSGYPTWQKIGRVLAEKEYIVMEQYASVLSNETAKEKYLRLLMEQPCIIQKAKVEHIASYLGVTRRTLSRIRREISI